LIFDGRRLENGRLPFFALVRPAVETMRLFVATGFLPKSSPGHFMGRFLRKVVWEHQDFPFVE
jgi:hypothetical protein